MSENATLQTIPTVACGQYPESICSMITLTWAIQMVRIYMRKFKSVKPPEIPAMGVSVSWQKNERRAKEIMLQTLPSTMPLLQWQTHDRDRDAFHCRRFVSCVPIPPFSQTETYTQPTHTHKHPNRAETNRFYFTLLPDICFVFFPFLFHLSCFSTLGWWWLAEVKHYHVALL